MVIRALTFNTICYYIDKYKKKRDNDEEISNYIHLANRINNHYVCELMVDLGNLNDTFNQTILLKVRLPRVIEAVLTGATLTLAGQMFQTVLNNPLADSFTLD